jgi:hypothetical protein
MSCVQIFRTLEKARAEGERVTRENIRSGR